MALLSFFDKREQRLTDKKFSKLTMEEAAICDWICLESPLEASKVMHDILGLDWRKMPFKSICEILQLRFGDTFFHKSEGFDFDTWNMLYFLGSNLNEDQKKFLRENNFLPHKYTSSKDEVSDIEKTVNSLRVSLVEFKNASQTEQVNSTLKKIDDLERQKIILKNTIARWMKTNPDGGNPADASEYISSHSDLRAWRLRNQDSATMKGQMFGIIINQMTSALSQAKEGKVYRKGEFGHYEERLHRRNERKRLEDIKNGKAGWPSFGNDNKPLGNKMPRNSICETPTVFTNTIARSSKLVSPPVVEPTVSEHEPKLSFTPTPVKIETEIEFGELEKKSAPEIRKMKSGRESLTSDYERIQKRVMDKKKQSTKDVQSLSKNLIITITILAAIALAVVIYSM